MEEILASIRRIISEDDAPAAGTADGDKAPEAAAAPAPADDVLELTDRFDPPAAKTAPPEPPPAPAAPFIASRTESVGDIEAFTPAPPPPRPAPRAPEPEPTPSSWSAAGAEVDEDEPLVAPHRAESAAGHFGALAQSLAMPAAGRSLEDVVRELLRPLLKEWLDQNLHQIVESRVQAEVERISRRRVY